MTRGHLPVDRTTALLGAAVVLALVALVGSVAIPGALADRDEPLRPALVEHRESDIRAGAVTGETVTLHVETAIGHAGGPARNVTVVIEAFDSESGILVNTSRSTLGTLDEEREYNATTPSTVPREGAYRIRTTVYEDGERRQRGSQTVRGLGTLVPEYARTTVSFHDFASGSTEIPSITYSIADVSDDRATLDVSAYLTNVGDEPAGDLRLEVLARQADSNIIADRASVDVGPVDPGETHTPGVTLAVPDDYNYHLDAILRRGEVIVATSSAPATLDPTETIPENETTRDVGLETGEFETETPSPPRETELRTEGAGQPGFGAIVGIIGILLAVEVSRRSER